MKIVRFTNPRMMAEDQLRLEINELERLRSKGELDPLKAVRLSELRNALVEDEKLLENIQRNERAREQNEKRWDDEFKNSVAGQAQRAEMWQVLFWVLVIVVFVVLTMIL
jgi:hypothetical protein